MKARTLCQRLLGVGPDFELVNFDTIAQTLVSPGDARRATPGDPCQCAIARSTRRTLGYPAAIGRTMAYLKIGPNTVALAEHNGRQVVLGLDRSGTILPNTLITFRAPCPSHRVGVQASRDKTKPKRKLSKKAVASMVAGRQALRQWERF